MNVENEKVRGERMTSPFQRSRRFTSDRTDCKIKRSALIAAALPLASSEGTADLSMVWIASFSCNSLICRSQSLIISRALASNLPMFPQF